MKKILLALISAFAIVNHSAIAQGTQPIYKANMLKNSKWMTQSNGKTIIPVSWENPDESNLTERQWVEEAISESWEKYSNIDFIDWGKATSASKGIRIRIDPYGWPQTHGLGNELNGLPGGMVLTFDFAGQFKCSGFSRELCIKFVAVHEFGHALGFAHEQSRSDCLCFEKPQGTEGDFYITPCDLESVMNYCNRRWNNYGVLSTYDISGLQAVYGKSTTLMRDSVDLVELKFIACTRDVKQKVISIQQTIRDSSELKIQKFTEEANSVPQKAIDKLPGLITIRYFHPRDNAKAHGLKTLIIAEGGNKRADVSIEDMSNRMKAPIPGYIEIWVKKPERLNGPIALEEIKLIACEEKSKGNFEILKSLLANSRISAREISEEKNPVPSKAVNNLPSKITIRYFHPDDEKKAIELQFLMTEKFAGRTILVENMMPRMSRLYPNYVEVWFKE